MLAGKTILVTGATGFLGGALVHRLAAEGAQVKALARRTGRDAYIRDVRNVEIVMGNITDAQRMHEVVAGCDIVFHVAAATNGTLIHQQRANITGTRFVAEAAAAHNVERLVHVSSIAVYGYTVPDVVTEDTPQRPGSVPYNRTKSAAETALRRVASAQTLTYSIVRPGMIFGPRSGMWTDTMYKLARLNPIPFVGNGHGTAYPIYVDDVVDLMCVLATHPAAADEAFNCVLDNPPITWREFLTAYSQLAGHDHWLSLPVWLAQGIGYLAEWGLRWRGVPQDVNRLIPYVQQRQIYRMDKARELLGWEPPTDFQTGIERCIPYLREKGLFG